MDAKYFYGTTKGVQEIPDDNVSELEELSEDEMQEFTPDDIANWRGYILAPDSDVNSSDSEDDIPLSELKKRIIVIPETDLDSDTSEVCYFVTNSYIYVDFHLDLCLTKLFDFSGAK